MLRLAFLALPLVACVLPDEEGRAEHHCETYTGTIFEPADGATVTGPVSIRMRWEGGVIPDRYTATYDDFSHFFIASDHQVHGDGSETSTFTELPPGGTFNFEMGWYCDAGNNGPAVVLANIRFHTAP